MRQKQVPKALGPCLRLEAVNARPVFPEVLMVGGPVMAGLFGRVDVGGHEAPEVRDQLLNFFRMIEIQFSISRYRRPRRNSYSNGDPALFARRYRARSN